MSFSHTTARVFAFIIAASVSTPAAAGSFCKDKADGLYAHPESCEQFVSCAADGLIEASMSCPSGLLWNDDGQYCDWPEFSTCETEATSAYALLFEDAVCDGHSRGPDSAIVGQVNGVEDIDACLESCVDNEACSSFAIGVQGDTQYCFLYSGDESQSDEHLVNPALPRYPEYSCYTLEQ